MPIKDLQYGKPIPMEIRNAEVLDVSTRGDGHHRVLKVIHKERPLVLKCYGLKRSRIRTIIKQFGYFMVEGKSSFSASGRCKTEREVLELWRSEGFDVPQLFFPDFLSNISIPCLAMEWIPGKTLAEVFQDCEIPLSRKKELIERFAGVLGNRHKRALKLQDYRFIFGHPTFSHVMLSGDRMVHFDFEIVYRKGHMESIIRREISGFIYSLAKSSKSQFPDLLKTLVSAYPDYSRIGLALNELQRYGAVPVMGWLKIYFKYFNRSKRYRRRISAVNLSFNKLYLDSGNSREISVLKD
ncbi:MAG: hypothetical protein MUO43_07515 [Desulfobacterales bacterium]|nr:hypothetical protein [Desulfobacterales bacterium]